MLSFSKIATLSALALGTLTQAVPLFQRGTGVDARATDLAARDKDTPTLATVLSAVTVKLNVALGPVADLTGQTPADLDLKAIFEGVEKILGDAAKDVDDLVGKPVEEILEGTGDVVLTVDDVLGLLCPIVDAVFDAIRLVLNVVVDLKELLDILPIVVRAVFCLLQAVIDVTKVVFENKLLVACQGVVTGTVVTKVLVALHLVAIDLH